ncbi:MAG: PA14 domain-containing protein [Chloroflexota bacterium]
MARDRVRPHRGIAVLVAILTIVQSNVVSPALTRAAIRPPETDEISAPATHAAGDGLLGRYYPNLTWSGTPSLERVDPTIDFNWGAGGHPIPSADFSIAWSGSLLAEVAGTYTFALYSDDGSTLSLDGALVVNNGGAHPPQQVSNTVALSAGLHTVSLPFFECCGGDALVVLSWTPPGATGLVVVPQAVLFSDTQPVEPAPPGTDPERNGGTGGDPVSTYSGAFRHTFLDLAIAGRGPAPVFSRSYNSADTRSTVLGQGWTHGYAARLRSPGDGTDDQLVVGPDGGTERYVANGDGTFSPPPTATSVFVRNPDGTFTLTDKAQARLVFGPSGNLSAISDRYGNTSTLGYNAQNELVSISDPAGRGSLALAYTNGLLTSVTDWASPARTVGYQYDANGRLWKVTDREGKVTTLGYDGTSSRLATITDARGNVALTLVYDAQGRVTSQKDAKGLLTGATTTFGYVVNGDGTRVTTVTNPSTSFEPTFSPTMVDTYNAQGFLTSRVTRPSSTETLTESYAYEVTGFRASVTDPRGNTTEFCYDRSHAGATIAGSRGNLTRIIGPAPTAGANRPVTLIAYDATNNVTQTVAPAGVASGTSVSCSTNLAAFDVDFATDLAYDAAGARLLSTTSRYTDPDSGATSAVTKYEYGDAANPGQVTRIIPPRGNTTASPDYTFAATFTYFGTGTRAGLIESTSDALGNKTTYDHDPVGRLTSSVGPLGNAAGGVPAEHRTEYVYDREDRPRFVKLPAPAAGGAQLVTETRYDEVGNRTVQIDANGQVTTYAYDNRDGLLQVKESPSVWSNPASPPGDAITTEYAYDAGGNMTRTTRAKGDAAQERVVDYVHDGRGLVRRETQYPSWPTTSPTLVATSTYDANGNLAVATDQLGRTTTMAYDLLNRPTSMNYSDPATPDVSYTYDANNNRTSMVDGTGTSTYTYDEFDRLLSVTTPGPRTVGYRYDRDGNRTRLIYPDATAVTYTFDKAGRMSGLADWASRTVGYTYFADGLVQTATNPNGTLSTYSYDNARRLSDVVHAGPLLTIDERHYSLDALGNVLGVAGGGTASAATTRVSESTTHGQGNGVSDDSYLSADGRFVTYRSTSSNLVADDTNGVMDVFVHDRMTGTTIRASVDAAGVQGNAQSDDSAISADGRYVTFKSQASNFVANDTNGTAWDIFRKDLQTGAISRVSTSSAGAQSNGSSHDPVISADGRYVAYRSSATNLVSGDANAQQDIFRKDTVTGTTILISVSTAGAQGNALSDDPQISDDGNRIAFHSDATTLVSGDSNVQRDAFLRDVAAGTTVRVSLSTAGAQGNGRSAEVALSGDGTAVAFESDASNLVTGDSNAKTDVFIHVLASGVTTRVSTSAAGAQGNKASAEPSLSRSATVIAFDSLASNLISGDTNNRKDIFTKDLASGTVTRMSVSTAGVQGNDTSRNTSVSADGQTVAFESDSTNLVANDTNAAQDVFVRGPGLDASTYAYDRLDRLTSVAGPDGARTYAYDPIGNRTSRVLSGSTTAYTYDRADRISAAGPTAISVTATGATTARGSDTFAYDQANRVRTATVAGISETSTYDGDGIRFSRQVGTGSLIRYVSDPTAGLPVTIDDGTRKYVWGLGLAYAVAGTAVEVQHADRLGSIRALTDGTGAVIATYRTDEFGVPTGSTGASGSPYRYTGEPLDASGLTYLRARHYDPSIGRFMSRDPFAGFTGHPLSLNRYSYVTNNPTTYADPSGLVSPGPRGGPGGGASGKSKVLGCGGEAHGALAGGGILFPWLDAADAAIYLCEGDVPNGLMSGTAIIPGLGDAIKWAGKTLLKALRVPAAVERIYSARVLARMAQEPGPFHNFPMSLDAQIFEGKRVVVSDTYVVYTQRGFANGYEGTYEIGVRVSDGGGVETIVHRFFKPNP